MSQVLLRTLCVAMLALSTPSAAFAQRELHWDHVEVHAHLDEAGNLRVDETQTMVFTGDWNGGERTFNIRPRQKVSLIGVYRSRGGEWQELAGDASLDDVDDYGWADAKTLRWRSRQPADPPFANTSIRYQLRYVLSGILVKDDDGYLLDHDFAFPDRAGTIDRFTLRLTLDPSWRPVSEVRDVYTASGIPPGRSFVLKIPLHYAGALVPAALDLTRPREIVLAVSTILGVTVLAILWFFVREQSTGRFAPVAAAHVDEPWLREHILKYPAEVIGAAWDDSIGPPEVVALIARMVSEGKLDSEVGDGGGSSTSMTLRLNVDRATLTGHERTLVEGLFFDGRTKTSTDLVKAHYHDTGFNPADAIRRELEQSKWSLLPGGDATRKHRLETVALFVVGYLAVLVAWYLDRISFPVAVIASTAALVITGLASIPGAAFRSHIHWGRRAAMLCLIPAMAIAAGAAAFLWFSVGLGIFEFGTSVLVAIVALVLGMAYSSINALKSRQNRAGIAVRKTLAAGREFFSAELRKERPALRDDWYPWVLALGLDKQVDEWSTQRRSTTTGSSHRDFSSSAGSSSSSEPFTGFGGGRSGGAGGGASWAAAAGGMAAGVSAPRSSGSDGGSSSSSGGSSSSSSSGGGGGGGW